MESSIDVLTRGGTLLACASEKLVNLNALLMNLQDQHNDFYAEETKGSLSAETSAKKALISDILSNVLNSEIREVEESVNNIQSEMIDARHKLYLCRNSTELLTRLHKRLNHFDDSLNKTRNQVAELRMQSFKLQRGFSAFKPENCHFNGSTAQGKMSILITNLKRHTAELQRQIIKMMEHREVYLQKKLSELRHIEEQLKSKLHHAEQASLQMEEAMEVIWGRFLEAENSTVVLTGISKELVGKLEVVQCSLNGSLKREAELKSELENCLSQLNVNDAVVKSLLRSIVEHIKKSFEVPVLMEKVNSLEEQLKKSETRLKQADDFNEEMQQQLGRRESLVDSLKERIAEAENRAETAEGKVMELTDANSEIAEEINLLKSDGENEAKKVTLLEEKVRELESQVQISKVSNEANQEQQDMLYGMIWDMEELIEDLKSKVVKAESRAESVGEQCVILSEVNMELEKEVSLLRSRVKNLESSLKEAKNSKETNAKQISMRSKLIMDAVLQLAAERERIDNKLLSLVNENATLIEKLRDAKRKVIISTNEACSDESEHIVSKLEVQKNIIGKHGNLGIGLKAAVVALIAVVFLYMIHKNEKFILSSYT